MKVCIRCKKEKPFSEYYKDSQKKDGLTPYCKDCRKEKAKIQNEKNPQLARDRAKRVREKDSLAYDLKRMGLTKERYFEMLEEQNGLCAVCKQPETLILKATGEVRRLSVDHNHSCCPGKRDICGDCNRGLLCNRCNRFLGVIGDDINILIQAKEYLEYYDRD